MKNEKPLWRPTAAQVRAAQMTAFREYVNQRYGLELADYAQLHQWSIDELGPFWNALWDFCGVLGDKGKRLVEHEDHMQQCRFFPQARLNYAENLLREASNSGADSDPALLFVGENGATTSLDYEQVRRQTAGLAAFLRQCGVGKGDRVAACLPNMAETVIAMLATSSLGAVWASCSPDFGVAGIVDRFAQIAPRVLFVTDGYFYNGKVYEVGEKTRAVLRQLPSVKHVVFAPLLRPASKPPAALPSALPWRAFDDIISDSDNPPRPAFTRVGFNDPLYIMFSSGTTGPPKCITHGVGGTLLQHLKEHRLHTGLRPRESLFYATTCGWMMWNWLASGLASGARLVLYDGNALYPNATRLFDLSDAHGINILGVSAKYIDALRNARIAPRRTHALSSLRAILSTGSPLSPEAFDYVYSEIKQDVCLSSISGGTDIISCFALGCETLPVHRGELQCRGLGMAVEAWNERGESAQGEKGELVCRRPFPSMPIGFWNDPDGAKYYAAYFSTYPGVWRHGDFVELTARGGMIIYGRSDAVLNPGGVRIGTAEIYRQVEQLAEIDEALVVGQQWRGDERVVLFVVTAAAVTLDDALRDKLRRRIREHASPRHVPAKIIAVPEIPRTRSGKIVELAVREVIHGREVKNQAALANPQALTAFTGLAALAED